MNNDWREYYDPQYVLMHHGVKGQKWGVRQYQNPDGTLTAAGKARYGSSSGRVEKFARKSAAWEGRAINARTGIGREFATAMATSRRMKADKTAAKATGDYKMLALNKNASRNAAAAAETNANVAAGLKKRAENTTNGAKSKYLMDRAVKHLATAENMETGAKSFKAISNAKGLAKGTAYVREMIKAANNSYTSAGRKSTLKDKFVEGLGEAVLDEAFNIARDRAKRGRDQGEGNGFNRDRESDINIASKTQLVTKARDLHYRATNSAEKRWKKIMND